jgi:hypothetical protein
MRPRYKATRGRYESEHWERPADFAKRRFCSRSCQSRAMGQLRVRPADPELHERIKRLRAKGWTIEKTADYLGVRKYEVVRHLYRSKLKSLHKPRPRSYPTRTA